MCSVQRLREVIRERLAAAAEEICGEFEKMIFQYEEEVKFQRRLLEITQRPKIKLHGLGIPQQSKSKEEESLTDQYLQNWEKSSALDQEEPEPRQMTEKLEDHCTSEEGEVVSVKLEADTLVEDPVFQENEQSEAEAVGGQQDEEGSQHVDSGSTEEEEEEPGTKKRRLTHRSYSNSDDYCLTSETLWENKTDAPQLRDFKEEEDLTVQQLWTQQRNNSLDQDAAQVYKEEESLFASHVKEQLRLKQEIDTLLVTPTFEENNSETESDCELLLSYNCPETESQDQGVDVQPGSSKHEEPKKDTQMMKLHRSHTVDEANVCDFCGKKFSQRDKLLTHMKLHTGEKQCFCETCGKRFSQYCHLKTHMRIHTGERPYCCDICGQSFTQYCNLKKHTRVHTGEKPFSCETCGQKFTESSSLRKHMRIHTGERPYSCEACGQSFTQRGNLKAHMRIHTGERPYSCKTCGQSFTFPGSLKIHTRIHSDENPYGCEMWEILH
ncbi:uncharacterized protein KZ484_025186 [Pholidichthys leucotaenia]